MKINLNYSIRRPFELNSALSSSVTFAFSSSILIFSFERSSVLSLIVVASWCFCAKIFLRESHGSRWIIRSHKSQLVIYCFQSLANFPLALSLGHETAAKVFLVGTSGPKGQVGPLLCTCTFTCSLTRCATNRVRPVAGILFRMASWQTATIATSCSI